MTYAVLVQDLPFASMKPRSFLDDSFEYSGLLVAMNCPESFSLFGWVVFQLRLPQECCYESTSTVPTWRRLLPWSHCMNWMMLRTHQSWGNKFQGNHFVFIQSWCSKMDNSDTRTSRSTPSIWGILSLGIVHRGLAPSVLAYTTIKLKPQKIRMPRRSWQDWMWRDKRMSMHKDTVLPVAILYFGQWRYVTAEMAWSSLPCCWYGTILLPFSCWPSYWGAMPLTQKPKPDVRIGVPQELVQLMPMELGHVSCSFLTSAECLVTEY